MLRSSFRRQISLRYYASTVARSKQVGKVSNDARVRCRTRVVLKPSLFVGILSSPGSLILNEEAILLAGSDGLSSQDSNLAKLLGFFGVSWRASMIADLLGDHNANGSGLRLLGSSDRFSALMADVANNSDRARQWREQIHSAFIYTGDDTAGLDQLVKTCPGPSGGCFTISNKLFDFCGVMAGIRIAATDSRVNLAFASLPQDGTVEVISSDRGAVFVTLEYEGVPVFLCSGQRIIDIEGELPDGIFDVRAHVLEAIPSVLYIRWAFPLTAWNAPERSACLIIDDPLLRPTYGFVDYGELLSLMRRHKFSTNIAFIPWNWQRSDPGVARLIRENPEYYSISVHGCAHTRAEFGSNDSEYLYAKARRSLEWMHRHEAATGVAHDRVMVFPQGVFSEAAMAALKQTDLIAAVNNDTLSFDKNSRTIAVGDVWDTAVMAYGNFPLFTRRYPWSGVENFAFDSLLGKPVVIVIHHDFCRHHCAGLIEFMERLNALACPLIWRSLGELVKRSCRQRVLCSDVTQVEMYGKELRIENLSDRTKQFQIQRRESTPSLINEIFCGTDRISWKRSEDRIQFEVELEAGKNVNLRLHFHEFDGVNSAENLNYTMRTTLRRYLCEFRDNYVHKFTLSSSNGN